ELLGDPGFAHAVGPQHRGALLGTRQAVGDEGEVVAAELLLAGVVERAVVRAPDPEVARLEALPQRVPVGGVAKRRRADVFGAFEAVAGEVGVAEREVLRARFGIDRAAATMGAA